MATKTSLRKHPKPEIQNPGVDSWTIHVNAKLVELESVKAASDRKWGENRLITLVDSGLREKFWVQNSKIGQAMAAKDQVRFNKAVDSMVRAYAVLETRQTRKVSSQPMIGYRESSGRCRQAEP